MHITTNCWNVISKKLIIRDSYIWIFQNDIKKLEPLIKHRQTDEKIKTSHHTKSINQSYSNFLKKLIKMTKIKFFL